MGKYVDSLRGTGRTSKMISQIIEKLSTTNEKILIVGATVEETQRIYSHILRGCPNSKNQIIKGSPRVLAKGGLFGIHLKKENVFIDHYVWDHEPINSTYAEDLDKLLDILKRITN